MFGTKQNGFFGSVVSCGGGGGGNGIIVLGTGTCSSYRCKVGNVSSGVYSAALGGRCNRNSGAPSSPSDIALSGDPFTAGGSGNFTLNTTAGAGAACTGAGWQSAILS